MDTSSRLYFATQNPNKLSEARAILGSSYTLLGLESLHTEPLREPYASLKENAVAKASYIADRYKVDCFAEDTGLFVRALGDEPGVHTSRYAGTGATDEENCQKLLDQLNQSTQREAYFCSLVALSCGGQLFFFEARCEGWISTQLKGASGFGYDPLFTPQGSSRSFAQMPATEKHRYSHRRKVLELLRKHLDQHPLSPTFPSI